MNLENKKQIEDFHNEINTVFSTSTGYTTNTTHKGNYIAFGQTITISEEITIAWKYFKDEENYVVSQIRFVNDEPLSKNYTGTGKTAQEAINNMKEI